MTLANRTDQIKYRSTRHASGRRTGFLGSSLLSACLIIVVSSATASSAATPERYRDDISFDIGKVPFSRYGSYLAFSHLTKGPLGEGLYLRSLHRGVRSEVLRVDLIRDGKQLSFREHATPVVLRLEADGGFVEICISEPYLVRVRGHGVGIRFSKPLDSAGFAFRRDERHWEFNAAQQDVRFMLTALNGNIRAKSEWDGTLAKTVLFEFDPAIPEGELDGALEEFRSGWHERNYDLSFEDSTARLRRDYQHWLAGMPTVPDEFQSAAALAAYVDWSTIVVPEGHLTRPSMLMSKNWMNAVWSWDHCFNAMALIESEPEIAWDQYVLMFDRQAPDGALPDSLTDREIYWAYSKPPIHGWVLQWLMNNSKSIGDERLAEAYPHLVRWTNWYFQFRDVDHDGLPQYDHGNDSGWDNSTVFRSGPAIETPDLAAELVLQMEALSNIAHRLGREQESEEWKGRADRLLRQLISSYWRSDHFVGLRSFDHAVVESDSLLLYLPIMLGKQLPEAVRRKLIAGLKQPGQFLTSNGLATERLGSPYYESDGYWRGPIWAPSTAMIVDGLESSGEREFARELKLRYCRMAVKSGFAENYDAVTGRGLRDPAYTWSASVFLIFAHQLVQP